MNICICTIIKDEHEYLEDWIKYTLNLGVDKIFIVEDIGSESHKSIIEKYSDNVEILNISCDMEFPNMGISTRQLYFQIEMFKYVKSLGVYDWCFIIDVDEYITITENISLKNLLGQYNDYSELIIYWRNFGANGHIKKPDYSKVSSYREYYTKKCGYSIFDKKYTYIMKKAINLHKIPDSYKINQHFHSMTTYTKTNFQKGIHEPCYDRVYLSHYVTKSWEEYKWKLFKRGMCCKNHRKIDDFFEMNTDMLPAKEKLISEI
jgi:hypothetical protein